MTRKFDPTKEYRDDFINVLKQTNRHFKTNLIEYSTTSQKYNFKYHQWKHPYQGDWEKIAIFTDGILDSLQKLISPDSVVIDIGAQAGLMSVAYAQFAKKVISFEPNPATFEVLEQNAELYNNIIPYNLACSTNENILNFHYSDEGFCNGGFATNCSKGIGVTGHNIPIDVYAVNITDFLNTYYPNDIANISLIKIDAEGHDKEIIKTLYPLLNIIRPVIITEMYAGLVDHEINTLISTIQNASYDIYSIGKINDGLDNPEKKKKITSLEDINSGEHGDLLCLPKNNI